MRYLMCRYEHSQSAHDPKNSYYWSNDPLARNFDSPHFTGYSEEVCRAATSKRARRIVALADKADRRYH